MGHVQSRTGSGRGFVARYTGLDGREHSKSFERRADARTWLRDREAEVDRGEWLTPTAARTTVREWAEQWYAGRTGIAPATLEQYRTVLDVDVLPELGDQPLRSLTRSQMREWVVALTTTRPWAAAPLAVSTATTRRNIVASILQSAVDEGLLTRSPMTGVKAPQRAVEVGPVDPAALPTAAELWALRDAAGPHLGEAVIVTAGSGLRQGELLGLRVRNARVLRREVEVVEQVRTAGPGQPVYAPLKTLRSRRRIPVGDEVCAALARHLAAHPAGPDDAVFRRPDGGLWRRTTFARAWSQAKVDAGVRPSLRWHELRHFYASALIAGGASVREVMERMGHTSAEETIARYSRLWPDQEETTRSIADAALRGGRDQDGTAAGEWRADLR